MDLPSGVMRILQALHGAGFLAYVVGGCVRDHLMQLPAQDFDIATSALPAETTTLFEGMGLCVYPTGIAHGTVSVADGHDLYEVTTFRFEEGYLDHRHPSKVSFVSSIEMDLSRRDFCMNAIAFAPGEGFVDPFHGMDDIQKKLVRCVRDPEQRFEEDALRILRGLRFSATLGFAIEAGTKAGIHRSKALLGCIAKERIQVELNKLLLGANAKTVLREFGDVFATILPELPWEDEAWMQSLDALALAEDDLPLRLSLLLQGDERRAANVLFRLKYSKAIQIQTLAQLRMSGILMDTDYALKCALNQFGPESCMRQIKRRLALGAEANEMQGCQQALARILQSGACYNLKGLAIGGNALLAAGHLPGKGIQCALAWLLDLVMQDKVENRPEALLAALQKQKEDTNGRV